MSRVLTKFRAAPANPHRDDDTPGRGGSIHRTIGITQVRDYYHRKQLKHARNAALVALTWAGVCVMVLVYSWVTTR